MTDAPRCGTCGRPGHLVETVTDLLVWHHEDPAVEDRHDFDPADGRPTVAYDPEAVAFTVQVYATVRPVIRDGAVVSWRAEVGGDIDFDFLTDGTGDGETWISTDEWGDDQDRLAGLLAGTGGQPVAWTLYPHRVAAESDAAIMAERTGLDLHLSPYEHPVIVCDDCGCLLTPMDDGEALYPDRYLLRGSDPDGSHDHDAAGHCACHDLPYAIPTTTDDNKED